MARKDDDFLLVEEKSHNGKYLGICAVIAILGFGGYALINSNKISSPSQPEAPLTMEKSEENKENKENAQSEVMPQADGKLSTDGQKTAEKIGATGELVKATINFAYDSSNISDTEKKKLQEFIKKVKENKGEIKIEGYADAKGTTDYNKVLSIARANETTDVLKQLGLEDKVKVSAQGLGMDKPVANNDSEDGRAKNRRAEIMFIPVK